MTKDALTALAVTLLEESGANIVQAEGALSPSVVGFPLYDAPLLGVAAADDPLFAGLKAPEAIGPHFRTPEEWLPGAKSVVCLFFPMSPEVRKENRDRMDWPGFGWMHARAEGMDMIDRINENLRAHLEALGYQAVSPVRMAEFFSREYEAEQDFTSNWSERHAAYISGLGTFGLSKGLITKKGVAGRFTSFITDLPLEADVREYKTLYEYCAFCGSCAKNCPAGAITIQEGKAHATCARFVNQTIEQTPQRPGARNRRYGCGKCQIKVPCEARAMLRRPRKKKEPAE